MDTSIANVTTDTRTIEHQPEQVAKAARSVVLYTLTDCFALLPEEILWAGYHLDVAFSPFARTAATKVPAAVRRELLDRRFSEALSRAEAAAEHHTPRTQDDAALAGSEMDWAAVLMQTLTQMWPMRPMAEAVMHGQIVGLLRELGVGATPASRAARYLPNDLRHHLHAA